MNTYTQNKKNVNRYASMHNLVVGGKYQNGATENAEEVTLEAVGRGDGLICIRWISGKLQLIRGDSLCYLTDKEAVEAYNKEKEAQNARELGA